MTFVGGSSIRARKACERCRKNKQKCDYERPCRRCAVIKAICNSPAPGSRSRDTRPEDAATNHAVLFPNESGSTLPFKVSTQVMTRLQLAVRKRGRFTLNRRNSTTDASDARAGTGTSRVLDVDLDDRATLTKELVKSCIQAFHEQFLPHFPFFAFSSTQPVPWSYDVVLAMLAAGHDYVVEHPRSETSDVLNDLARERILEVVSLDDLKVIIMSSLANSRRLRRMKVIVTNSLWRLCSSCLYTFCSAARLTVHAFTNTAESVLFTPADVCFACTAAAQIPLQKQSHAGQMTTFAL